MPPRLDHPLAHLRHQRGWSLHEVACIAAGQPRPDHDRKTVWRWERGLATPSPESQYRLAAAVGISVEQVHQHPWPGWLMLTGGGPPMSVDLEWTTGNAAAVLEQALTFGGMDRRRFIVVSGSLLAGAVLDAIPEPITRGLNGAHVGDELVDGMYARLEQLWRLDDQLGGGACLPAALGDLRLALTILRRARFTGATEQQIFGLIAAYGRFCGWAAFDDGQHAAAQEFWHAALRAAHAGGDSAAAAYTLSNLGLQSVYVERGRSAVDLLEAARQVTDPAHRIMHAMLDCWQARAHAAKGEHSQAARLLNRADDTWSNRSDDDPSGRFCYWLPQPSLTSEAGTAMMDCGDYAQAEQMLTAGLSGRIGVGARDRNLYRVRLAELGIRTGRLDEAYHHGAAAVDAVVGIMGLNSHRVIERVDLMLGQFPARDPRTRDLADRIREQRQLNPI